MDKLTLTHMAGMFRELLTKLDARTTPYGLVRCMIAMFEDEAARREDEQKRQEQERIELRKCKRPDACMACDTECEPFESEGLGSAAAREFPLGLTQKQQDELLRDTQATSFCLEVGKSYARRDGTGPEEIVRKDRVGALFYDAKGNNYFEDGRCLRGEECPADLVSLWQAEAQAPQTDADDLVQRLRNTPNWRREEFGDWKSARSVYDRAPFEAADHIEAQARDIARLTTQLAHYQDIRDERDALKARVARLEDALRDIATDTRQHGDDDDALLIRCQERARAALAGDKTNG